MAFYDMHHRTADFRALLTRTLSDLKEFIGTQNDVLILASSGTGVMEASVSNLTSPGLSASAFFVTSTRPVRVPAHSVPLSLIARSVATTYCPARLPPNVFDVRSSPIGAQSPHGAPRKGLKTRARPCP